MRRLGTCLASTNREALGFRPALRKGSATVSWLDGDRRAARKRRAQGSLRRSAKSPEERTRVLRRRGGASRGDAVCLYFPAIRETSRGRYQGAPFGAPSPLKKGRSTKSSTRAAARERGR